MRPAAERRCTTLNSSTHFAWTSLRNQIVWSIPDTESHILSVVSRLLQIATCKVAQHSDHIPAAVGCDINPRRTTCQEVGLSNVKHVFHNSYFE
jgi:hypothetical protein